MVGCVKGGTVKTFLSERLVAELKEILREGPTVGLFDPLKVLAR